MSVDEVQRAIEQLYRPHDPLAQKRANEWLLAFQTTERSWAVAAQLLHSPAFEVQHYAANLLFHLASEQWSNLKGEDQLAIRGLIFSELRNQAQTSSPVVSTKLALALSAIAVSTRNGLGDVLNQVLGLAIVSPMAVLQVLSALPEQVSRARLPFSAQEAAAKELRGSVGPVMELVCQQLARLDQQSSSNSRAGVSSPAGSPGPAPSSPGSPAAGPATQLAVAALEVAVNWQAYLKLTVRALFKAGLLHATLSVACKYPMLFLHKVSELVCETLQVSCYPREQERDAGVRLICEALLHLRSLFERARTGEQGLGVCMAICRLSAAVGESEGEFLAQGSPLALQLVDLHLAVTSHPDKHIVDLSLDFWQSLETVPLASRHPQLGAPLFRRLLAILLRQAAYPLSFRSWDNSGFDMDQDTFNRFRNSVEETLLVCFSMLHAEFLLTVSESLSLSLALTPSGGGSEWQSAEASLFALCAVAHDVRDMEVQVQVAVRAPEVVGAVMSRLVHISATLPSKHPLLLASIARFVSKYSFFIVKSQPGTVESMLSLLLSLVKYTEEAAMGFKLLCGECASVLGNKESLMSLLSVVHSSGQLDLLPLATRKLLIAGLAQLNAAVKGSPSDQLPGLQVLLTPFLQKLHAAQLNFKNSPDKRTVGLVVEQLSLILAVVNEQSHADREAPGSNPTPHPLFAVLNGAWGLLQEVGNNFVQVQEVSNAWCELMNMILLHLDRQTGHIARQLVALSVIHFRCSHQPTALDLFCTVLNLFNDLSSQIDFVAALQGMTEAAARSIQDPEVITSYFQLLSQSLSCFPLGTLPILPQALALASDCLTAPLDRNTGKALVDFLAAALGNPLEAFQQALRIILIANHMGARIVHALIVAMASTAPQHLVGRLAVPLYALVHRFSSELITWVDGSLSQLPSTTLSPQDRGVASNVFRHFAAPRKPEGNAATERYHKERERRFRAFLLDLSTICRGQNTSDTLLAYLLDNESPKPRDTSVVVLD